MQHLLLRYTQALITQMAQTAVCNRHHSVDQQLCRWLLLSLDRLPSNELTMTQELIANMLGVRREGVTEAAGKLQTAGLIHYSRGRITVLDRPRPRSAGLRVLRRGQAGIRSSVAARHIRVMTARRRPDRVPALTREAHVVPCCREPRRKSPIHAAWGFVDAVACVLEALRSEGCPRYVR